MSHPPSPRGATGPELQVLTRLHRALDHAREPMSREAMAEAIDLIVGLIDGRAGRRGFDAACELPDDGG